MKMRLFHKCNHDWHLVKEWEEPDLSYSEPHFKHVALIYCPKRGKIKKILADTWECMCNISKIDKSYKESK